MGLRKSKKTLIAVSKLVDPITKLLVLCPLPLLQALPGFVPTF